MVYDLDYEIAAIIISVILLIFLGVNKKTSNFQNRMFFGIVILNMITAVSDVMVQFLKQNWCNLFVIYFLAFLYFISHSAIPALFYFYTISNAKEWYQLRKFIRFVSIVPILVVELYTFVDILFFHTICTYTADGEYRRGYGLYVLYACMIIYMISVVYTLIRLRSSYSFIKRLIFFGAVILSTTAVLLQYTDVNLRVETFAIELIILICFYYIQNPYYQIDRETNLFNKSAFYELMKLNISKHRDVDVIILVVQDFEDIFRSEDDSDEESITCQISAFLENIDEDIRVYRIDKNIFALEIEVSDENDIKDIEDVIQERFKNTWKFDDYRVQYKIKICHIPLYNNSINVEGLMGLVSEIVNGNYDKEILDIQDFDLNILERGMMIKTALVNAIENDLFELTFSPIYSKTEKKITAMEVSSRFLDKKLGYVSEAEIMRYAECSGQMIKLGAMLFDKTCEFISKNDLKSYGISFVGIKLSSVTCLQYEFISNVNNIFSKYQIDPAFICFQISEYTVSKISKVFEAHMDILSNMGFRFCLDDYGSGFTNLASIYEFSIDFIKIDARVVRAARENEKAKITLESTLDLANELSMKTIMGGISTVEEFDMVSQLICDYEIGSYFCQDVDETTFLNLLKDNNDSDKITPGTITTKQGIRKTLTSAVAARLFRDINKDSAKDPVMERVREKEREKENEKAQNANIAASDDKSSSSGKEALK